jgi:hypothetical protein
MMIQLSKSLHAGATKRATQLRFSTVDDYIADLIRRVLGTKPKLAAVEPLAKGPLRGRLFPVKPANARGILGRKSATALRKEVLDGMFSYMKASEDPGYGYACGYKLKHIDRCAAITREFLDRLSAIPRRDASSHVIGEVRRVVLRLNKLNKSCGGVLIETDQRELLCQFIFAAARRAGLPVAADITVPWRTW